MADIDVLTEISGSVWKLLKQPGDTVDEFEPIMVLESMKMEIPVVAPQAGTLNTILVEEGQAVTEGDVVATLSA